VKESGALAERRRGGAMASESRYEEVCVSSGLPEQRNAQQTQAAEGLLPRQSDAAPGRSGTADGAEPRSEPSGSGAAESSAAESSAAESSAAESSAAESSGADSHAAQSDAPHSTGTDAGLSERDRAVLDFEKRRWRHAGAKEQDIRDRFGISATRYYQVLNALLDRPEALAFEPLVVNRLRRLREARQRARSGRIR
jgi:hypothetical protein